MLLPLSTLSLRDFRLAEQLQLPLDPRLTVLHGENAGGKTTVLDALAIGMGAVLSRMPAARGRDLRPSDLRQVWHQTPLADLGMLTSSDWQATTAPVARITLEAANGLRWDRSRRREPAAASGAPAIGVKDLLGHIDPLVASAQAGEAVTLPVVAYYGTDRSVPHLVTRRRGLRQTFGRFDGLQDALSPGIEWKDVFGWFQHAEDAERRAREKRRDFDYRLPILEAVRRATERALPQCRNPRTELSPTRFVVDYQRTPDGPIESLAMQDLSHGFRTHAAMVIDLARRMAIVNPHLEPEQCPALVLIDEVDLHLHPRWQQTVLPALLDAFKGTQWVVSTHSDQVISSVDREHVRSLRLEEGALHWARPPFAEGATAEEVQTELMGVPPRAPSPTATKLAEYRGLVAAGHGRTLEAQALRGELEEKLPGRAVLHRADLEMKRQEVLGRGPGR